MEPGKEYEEILCKEDWQMQEEFIQRDQFTYDPFKSKEYNEVTK